MAKESKNYTEDFKKQIVALKINGKSTAEIVKEYQVAKSTIIQWVNDYNNSGSFKAKDNRSEEENELNKLCKEIKQLQMKNEVISIFRASKNNYGSRKIKIK